MPLPELGSFDIGAWVWQGALYCNEHVPLPDFSPFCEEGCEDPGCCPQPLDHEEVIGRFQVDGDGNPVHCLTCMLLEAESRRVRGPYRAPPKPHRTLLEVLVPKNVQREALCALHRARKELS